MAWGKPVLDRVGLIIEIFNAHAFTKEAKLQVGDVSWCPCSQIELNVLCCDCVCVVWIWFGFGICSCRRNSQLCPTRRPDLFAFVALMVAIHLGLLEKLKLLAPEG